MRRWTVGFWLTMLGTLLLTYALSEARTRNTHGLASSGEEQAAWWGGAGQAHVVSGCIHGLSGTTSATIASCQAFTLYEGPPEQLRYAWEDEVRTITYYAGDGTYWLIAYAGSVTDAVPGGWTRVANTSYLWQLNAVHPTTIPNNAILLMASTVAGSAITVVDTTLHATNPFIFDRTEYASRYGFKCDGLASSAAGNDAALVAAVAALPLSGGRVVLPAERFTCTLSAAFAPTKTVWLQGSGGGRVNAGFFWRTKLEYVGGAGNIIEIINKPTVGMRLEGFELINAGTATTGILTAFTSNIHIEDVSMNIPAIKFTDAAIVIGDTDVTHSVTIQRAYIRDTGPTGLRIQRTNHVKVENSTFRHHTACNIDVGGGTLGRAKDTRIISTAVENTKPGATAICIFDAEGTWIQGSHFEQSGGSFAAIATFPTSFQADHLVIRDNWFTVIGVEGAPSSYNVISFDRPNTYAIIGGNRLLIQEDATLASNAFVSVPNTSGAAYVTLENNFMANNTEEPPPPPLLEIAYIYNVSGRTKISGNYGYNVGQIPITPDSGSPWCITGTLAFSVTTGETALYSCLIPKNTLYRENTTGFRFTVGGTTGANANNKRVRLRFGDTPDVITGTVFWDTGTQVHNAGNWQANCSGVRSDNSSGMRISCHGGMALSSTAGISLTEAVGVTATGGWSVDQYLIITGEAATANADVTLTNAVMEIIR